MNPANEREKVISQWIISLAISVVCCALLFLVFAGYIVKLHDKIAATSVEMSATSLRLEMLLERQSKIVAELDSMRRASAPPAPVVAPPAGVPSTLIPPEAKTPPVVQPAKKTP